MPGAEVGLGEGLDGAGQVAEGDAAVDDQPLDLVEDREVAGVGRVEPEALARHHGVDRQRAVAHRLLHQVDLHRRGVGAQQHRLGLADVEVHGVVHAAGRVGRRHVERLEVVPVRLGLGALGDGEAHADEDVLELVPGLGHQVEVATRRAARHLVGDDLGQVEAVRPQRRGPLGLGQLGRGGPPAGPRARPRTSLQPASGLLARLGVEPAQGRGGPGSARSACRVLGLHLGQGVGRRARPRWPARRRRRSPRCRAPRCQSPCRVVRSVADRDATSAAGDRPAPGVAGTPRSRPPRRPRPR